MTELYASEWIRVVEEGGVVRVVRSAAPAPAVDDQANLYADVAAAVKRSGARRVLVDLRGSPPGRNDPEFERASEAWRRALATDFDRVAILVRTAVGKLHIQRLGREIGGAPSVFLDEAEALAFVRSA